MELLAGLSTREIGSTHVERQCLVISHGLNPQPRRSKRRALPVELQERKRIWSIVPDCPMSQVQGPKSVFRRLTLDFKRWTLNYPLTQTTCLISATISTRSSWFFITASIDL